MFKILAAENNDALNQTVCLYPNQNGYDAAGCLNAASGPRTVDVCMTKLHAKFTDCDVFEIVTVRGLGCKAVLQ